MCEASTTTHVVVGKYLFPPSSQRTIKQVKEHTQNESILPFLHTPRDQENHSQNKEGNNQKTIHITYNKNSTYTSQSI